MSIYARAIQRGVLLVIEVGSLVVWTLSIKGRAVVDVEAPRCVLCYIESDWECLCLCLSLASTLSRCV